MSPQLQLTIRTAGVADIPVIQSLTRVVWPATYSSILPAGQIEYMLDLMYSTGALTKQMQQLGHSFIICDNGEESVGFASYSRSAERTVKLHKIYILPTHQGKGVGKFMMNYIIDSIRQDGVTALDLNVNRYNPAIHFYRRLGFFVLREEDIDIGGGYWMNDFVMRREIA